MATPALSARLRYLNDAAHLLTTTSPATSSYMMSQYNKVAFDHDLTLPEARRREVCGACGNIMVIGWSCHAYPQAGLEKETRPSEGSSAIRSSEGSPTRMNMIYECRICNRKTRQGFQKRNNEKQRPSRQGTLQSMPSRPIDYAVVTTTSTIQSSIKPSSVNTGSKRRAKARKQSGLQAMLARAKAENTSSGPSGSFGLDLMDLMKSSQR